ncbi:MAG: fructose-bisphosphate aldolase class I [Actinomycetota bacterium]|nr:fructose-bisphosphate aldolase class I [Actinomycetota bacterium]
MSDLKSVAAVMVATGRGVLAADESVKTMSARLVAERIEATKTIRRDYRELLLTAPGLRATVSGMILCDETFNDQTSEGQPFPQACRDRGVLAGIKVDTGTTPLAGDNGATITEGLDGLGPRLADYAARGAAFAKWRAVIDVTTVSEHSLEANADSLARYAALCQENGIVPIVEPEVLATGPHDLRTCADVTEAALTTVFTHLERHQVDLSGLVLKPNMVTPGLDGQSATPDSVATTTLAVLAASVPATVPGIAFLSGGHPGESACRYLGAINAAADAAPWSLTFSFGRALVSDALHAWKGDSDCVEAAQAALLANCRRAAEAIGRRTVGPGS